jgi:hypothetical protein
VSFSLCLWVIFWAIPWRGLEIARDHGVHIGWLRRSAIYYRLQPLLKKREPAAALWEQVHAPESVFAHGYQEK